MFEIVRYQRPPSSGRDLARQLAAISAEAAGRHARLNAMTGLLPAVMERTAALTALEQLLAAEVPAARTRLSFIVDVATAAMTEVATEMGG